MNLNQRDLTRRNRSGFAAPGSAVASPNRRTRRPARAVRLLWLCLGLALCSLAGIKLLERNLIASAAPPATTSETPPAVETARIDSDTAAPAVPAQLDRSPVDLAITRNGRWLITANQTSNTISLIDRSTAPAAAGTARLVTEVPCGEHPVAIVLSPDERQVIVAAAYAGELNFYDLVVSDSAEGELRPAGTIHVGFAPHGIALTRDGLTAYVAQEAADAVAVVSLAERRLVAQIPVARWPRYLALSPDESRLAIGTSGESCVSVVDPQQRKLLYTVKVEGINLGHMRVSDDGLYAYFPFMVYRNYPINAANVRRGWVLGTRIGRVRLDGPARRQAITLDPQGEAMADVHGLDFSPDGEWLVCTSSGTQELLVFRVEGIPWADFGGPGDHLERELQRDRRRFYRVPLGGRPLGCHFDADGQLLVANYLLNSVQQVDLGERRVARSLPLGGPVEPSLARRGEALFYDARRSLDQWYSCHSCHYEGGTNAVAMDTRNDRTERTFKTVPTLVGASHTGPWTWHGWQTDLGKSIDLSYTETMLGPRPSEEEVAAVLAWMETLSGPPNPYRQRDALEHQGALSPAAQRGEAIFHGTKAACASCHSGPHTTDGQIHDLGLGSPRDALQGFNTPSLRDVYRKTQLMHDGRARSLESLLTEHHSPAEVSGSEALDENELRDLIEYLKTL